MEIVFGIVAVFLLVFANGFFVAAEFSLVGARRTRIAQLAAEGNAGAKAAQDAINHLDNYIAATQLGITLASLALGWIGEPAVARLLEPLLEAVLPEELMPTVGHTVAIAVGFSIVTTLHIVLGELAPKSIALQRPEEVSMVISRPTRLFLRLFRPIIWVMNGVGNWVVRLLGFEPAGGHAQVHSAEELEMLVQSSREAGLLQPSEEILLRRVFDFSDVHVEEIMQPRVEVEAIPVDMPLADLLSRVSAGHHSRYPVYEDTIDHIVGVLHTKDLLDMLIKQPGLLTSDGQPFSLKSVLRAPLFVPGTLTVDKLLEKMQKAKTHLTVVIDEYGGMAGLATMEDIIEELVGDVQDEFDVDEEHAIRAQGDVAEVDGLVSMNDVMERFGELKEEALSTSIGGFVAERLDRIPTVGDQVRYGDYDVRVEEMDGMRVARVRFIKRPQENVAEAEERGNRSAT